MKNSDIYIGGSRYIPVSKEVGTEFVTIEGERFFKLTNYNAMKPFFMSIVSDSDHWMFLSSNGSLTAGRKNRDNALFPYYPEDKIHDYRDITGSKTFLLVDKDEKRFLWEPFSEESEKIYKTEKNLYKSIYGNKVIFEEYNIDLGVGFQYGWYNSEKFGFIKKSKITNLTEDVIRLEVLDGIKNILPYGLNYDLQIELSNLLDAYKKNELLEDSTVAVFSLSSIPVDKAEPSEALKATTVWSAGLQDYSILISDKQVENFKKGLALENEVDIRATRGAYFINTSLELRKMASQEWLIVAEINQDSFDVANLCHKVKTEKDLIDQLNTDIKICTSNLINIVAKADGLQKGNEELSYVRHFSNTMFNVMRGGIFTNNYLVDIADFRLFVKQTNQLIYNEFEPWLNKLEDKIQYEDLIKEVEKTKNPDFERIIYEYLPLTFSRRHGDPSRPWNQFSIETKNSDGSDKLSYEGNWRDIFQNWEALSFSFPGFIEGMINKFLNATTADGYNPYRITREGIDWEAPDPDDPWSYIGYWGDHQIIYLLKFLELIESYYPGRLDELMTKNIFLYANVPYHIKSFEEIVENPKDTIVFDHDSHKEIESLAEQIGADGRLLRDSAGQFCRANLMEKILVTLLSKLSNFIPGAGIWMNTQRPEWNDANNALVGNGASMVTLYYLRRFLQFWNTIFINTKKEELLISLEVIQLFNKIITLFEEQKDLLETGFSDEDRFHFANVLGTAGSEYRQEIYKNSFSGKKGKLQTASLRKFASLSIKFIDQSIQENKRKDGLFHAYNLISIKENSISIRYLYEMLEGQVGVLSSGYLSPEEGLDVLDAMKVSKLFRSDQYSYLLYPNRQLARFTEKNNIQKESVEGSELLRKLISNQDSSILKMDNAGNYHFNGVFRNSEVLSNALEELDSDLYAPLVKMEKQKVLDIYEEMFDHQSFTGRSGTFYGYEGLGSIYWHMVSKLLLSVEENYFEGIKQGHSQIALDRIKDHYYEIKAGIGLYKSPEIYGAFPTDPYSHSPSDAGVKQPGLTGQVKEDFLSRMGELGVFVKQGEILFSTSLMNTDETLKQNEAFEYLDLSGEMKKIDLLKGQLGFTFCQVPVIYSSNSSESIVIVYTNGKEEKYSGNLINREISSKIFNRSGEVGRIEFYASNIK